MNPSNDIHVTLPKMHPGQRHLDQTAKRYNVASMGRRFGKTVLGIRLLAKKTINDSLPVAWFAPNYKLLDEAWREAKRRLHPAIIQKSEQSKRLDLSGGGSIEFWTLEDESAGRGRKYARVVVDEAAHAKKLRESWEQAVAPTLTDYRGDGWFMSTPNGMNYFHELWLLGQGGREDWQSWQMPTTTNPFIDPSEVANMRGMLPERVFRQEYMAEFLEDGAGVFRGVDRAPESLWLDHSNLRDSYVIGCDWGRHNDFSVFTVLNQKGELVHIDRFTDIGYELQVGRLKNLWERFSRCPILAESNSMGGPLIERLQRERMNVHAFHTTNASKSEAIESLALAIENGQISFPHDERVSVLKTELVAFDQERLPSGMMRYGAPSGQHDDTVMALAIAWHGVHLTKKQPVMMKIASL